jgi:hypothetical protein
MSESPSRDEHAEALEAMADGLHETQTPEEPEQEPDRPEALETEQDESESTDAAFAVAQADASSGVPAKQRAERSNAQARKVTHAQISRFMFPITLISGLVVLGLATAVVLFKPNEAAMPVPPLAAKIITFAAFPLGLLLLVGSWWFHHEGKHS